jgi:NADH:ubiquinone oxidoreductase subunit K
VTLTPIGRRPIITGEMSEHAFQQLMLGIVSGEVAVVIVAFLVFWYKTRKSLDQIEGISAAVYLEVKRTLREHRS